MMVEIFHFIWKTKIKKIDLVVTPIAARLDNWENPHEIPTDYQKRCLRVHRFFGFNSNLFGISIAIKQKLNIFYAISDASERVILRLHTRKMQCQLNITHFIQHNNCKQLYGFSWEFVF